MGPKLSWATHILHSPVAPVCLRPSGVVTSACPVTSSSVGSWLFCLPFSLGPSYWGKGKMLTESSFHEAKTRAASSPVLLGDSTP